MAFRHSASCLVVAAAVGATALLAPVASQSMTVRGARPAIGARVAVMDNYFEPRSITIDRGKAVKWRWKGANRHNVIFTKVPARVRKKKVRSRVRGRIIRALRASGTYRYHCTLYDGMQGTIKVAAQ